MEIANKWRSLGYQHIVWELLRYFLSLRGADHQKRWLDRLKQSNVIATEGAQIEIAADAVNLFFEYLEARSQAFATQYQKLRNESEALDFCLSLGLKVGKTVTKNTDHHQASKALVGAVSFIAEEGCRKIGISVNTNPQRRCIWCTTNGLHVTARNLDGALPSTTNPIAIWEIKEYWGKTSGGSKMSDAVYECNLVGRELRDFERASGISVKHLVFVDGKDQWFARQSDFRRFIDLAFQGLIDELYVGRDVETVWSQRIEGLARP